MISKLVKMKRSGDEGQELDWEIPKNKIIELPRSARYGDLEAAIIKKTSYFKRRSLRVDIFKNPPSHDNMLIIQYYHSKNNRKHRQGGEQKTLKETKDIKDGDQFYAIVHNKNKKKSNHIAIFLDNEFNDQIAVFLLPKYYVDPYCYEVKLLEGRIKRKKMEDRIPFYQGKILQVAKKTLIKLAEENRDQVAKDGLSGQVDLVYPLALQKLADEAGKSPFELLRDGDRVSLRRSKAVPVTLTVTILYKGKGQLFAKEAKTRSFQAIFYSNTYVGDIVTYLKKNLHWSVGGPLMYQKEEDGKVTYQPLPNDRRLERLPFLNQEEMNFFVRKRDVVKETPKLLRPCLYLVVNKRATSDLIEGQNPRIIYLQNFNLAIRGLEELISAITVALEIDGENHNYSKMQNRLTIYRSRPQGDLKKIFEPGDKKQETIKENYKGKELKEKRTIKLEQLDVKEDDTIFAIIASDKNPTQVSFFVQDNITKEIVLITDNIQKNLLPTLEITQSSRIRKKAIAALLSIKKNQLGLPLLDTGIVEKTELVFPDNKSSQSLKNGNQVTIRLKEGFQTIRIDVATNNEPNSLRIAVPVDSQFGDILREVENQVYWDDHRAKALFFQSTNGDWVELTDEDYLKERDRKTSFCLRYKDDQDQLKSSEKEVRENSVSKVEGNEYFLPETTSFLGTPVEKKKNDSTDLFTQENSDHSSFNIDMSGKDVISEDDENKLNNDEVTESDLDNSFVDSSVSLTLDEKEEKYLEDKDKVEGQLQKSTSDTDSSLSNTAINIEPQAHPIRRTSLIEKASLLGASGITLTLFLATWGNDARKFLKNKINTKS